MVASGWPEDSIDLMNYLVGFDEKCISLLASDCRFALRNGENGRPWTHSVINGICSYVCGYGRDEDRTESKWKGTYFHTRRTVCECAVLGSCIFLFRMHSYRHSHIAYRLWQKMRYQNPCRPSCTSISVCSLYPMFTLVSLAIFSFGSFYRQQRG